MQPIPTEEPMDNVVAPESNHEETNEADCTHLQDPNPDVIRRILVLMGPILVGSVLSFSAQTITNSFVGRRLGASHFAHYTLGISVANLFGYSIGIGLNGALDTFVSQAYGRDGQATRDIGVSVQRATVLSLCCAVPLAFVFMFGGPIYRFVFGEDLGNGALLFTRYAVPNLVFCFLKDILTKTLQAINMPKLVLYSTLISASSCVVLNYFFTTSVPSAVLVLTATDGIQFIALLCLTRWHPQITFWRHCQWPSRDGWDFAGIALFLKVGIPALVAVCAQWWAFEALDVVAASISVDAVATANLVMMSVGLFYFSMAYAISIATCILVGNALGENRPALARQTARIGFAIDQCMNLANGIVLIIFRRQIARIFINDEALEATFSSMILVVVGYVYGDSTQFCLQSIHKGAAQQKAGAKTALLSLWAVGLPMSVALGKWAGLGGLGVLMGILCGFCVGIPTLIIRISSWPWEMLALQASQRLGTADDAVDVANRDEMEIIDGEHQVASVSANRSDDRETTTKLEDTNFISNTESGTNINIMNPSDPTVIITTE